MKTLLPDLPVARLLAVLVLLSAAAQAADLTTDTLTVNEESSFYGPVELRLLGTGLAPTNGLLLHYAFDTDQTNVVDGSGNGRTGLAVGGIAWTTNGIAGGCFDFDGANDYVNTGYPMQPEVRVGTFSFSIWFNTDDGNATAQYLFGARNTSPSDNRSALLLYGSGSLGYLDLTHTSVGTQYSLWPAKTYADGPSGWHNLVATVDDAADQIRVYINGVEDANSPRNVTMNLTGYSNIYNVFVGALNNNGSPQASQYFNGRLDEFRIYNRVLSAAEVAEMYLEFTPSVSGGGTLSARQGSFTEGITYSAPLGDISMGVYTNAP